MPRMLLLQEYLEIRKLLHKLLSYCSDEEIVIHFKSKIKELDERLKEKRFSVRKRYQDRILTGSGVGHKPFHSSMLKWD